MATIFTPMTIFNKPGPLRTLLEERGFDSQWAHAPGAENGKPTKEETAAALMARAPEMELLIADTTPLDSRFFEAATKLKLVAMFGVGLDHIDVRAATDHGVLVTNVPGGNARCVTELAFALMLDLAHRVVEMHTSLVNGAWRPRLGSELAGKTLGVVGLGHIGQDVARIGKALGMKVIAANRTPRPETARQLGIAQVSLDEVLREADYLTLHIPGGPGSWHFGAPEFAKMKPTARIINTARGNLLDLDALAEALEAKRLAGAGLDVFSREPMDPGHPLFSLPHVVVTPHAGGLSAESMARVCASCLDEAARVLSGKRSPNARNEAVYSMPGWEDFT